MKILRNFFNRISFMKEYSDWVYDVQTNKSFFVPITDTPFRRKQDTPKIFAYYLTQFHPIQENDDAHGKGFTEWTNVAGAVPQFVGHCQPNIPYDIGFYNLLDINVMKRQVELAKMYGIYGFCFYYYWFSGRKVLEKPLYNFLHSDIDFHFHFCWANENWSKLWDGVNKEVILEQKLISSDAKEFYKDILPFIKDHRYEKIDNKPLLCVYHPEVFDKKILLNFMNDLNKFAYQDGFDGFYFMANNVGGFNVPSEWGFDGIIEFPPHGVFDKGAAVKKTRLCDKTNFVIKDLTDFVINQEFIYETQNLTFKACFPSWDNTPRKAYSNGVSFSLSDTQFEKWLSDIILWTRQHNAPDKQYIYINAWNEWGEGAMLEPTKRFGYKSLSIIKSVLERC